MGQLLVVQYITPQFAGVFVLWTTRTDPRSQVSVRKLVSPCDLGSDLDETYNSIKCTGMVWASSKADPWSIVLIRPMRLFNGSGIRAQGYWIGHPLLLETDPWSQTGKSIGSKPYADSLGSGIRNLWIEKAGPPSLAVTAFLCRLAMVLIAPRPSLCSVLRVPWSGWGRC